MSQDRVEAVERALTIVNAFRLGKAELTLAELASATGFYKSTILRLAGSLERFGYLVRQETGVFRLGPALCALGSAYQSGLNLGDAIRPVLRKLVEATGETASFYVREKNVRVCLFRQNSPQAARHHLDEGAQLPMNAGASAHVLLACSGGTGAKAQAVRDAGYCISLGERDPHVAAVAVPVVDAMGHCRGALAVSGLIARFDAKAREAALAELLAAARQLGPALPAAE